MKNALLILILLLVVIGLPALYEYWVFSECRGVGHSIMYCVLNGL